MADEEVVIRVVMEDAATGGGAGGTGGAPGSLTPRQIAKQAADIQVTLARGAAQAAVQMGLAQGRAQAQLYAANARAQAQAQGAFGKMYAQVSQQAAKAAKAHADAAQSQAKAAAAPALLAAKLQQEQAKAAAMPALLEAQTQAAYAKAQTASARAQIIQAKAAEGQKTWFDTILDVMDKLRGTLGGLFGTVVGGTLDLISAHRKSQTGRQSQATPTQIAQASRALFPGEQVPVAPPGMEWGRLPESPRMGPGGMGPPTPFSPGQLVPKRIYSKAPVAGIPGGAPFQPGVLAPGQPGTSPLAGMSGSGAAGGAVAAIKALVAFGYAIKDTTNVVVDSGSKFATSMISASAAPSKFIGDVSSSIRSFGDSMGVFGALISNVGALGQTLGSVMGEVNQMADRYGAVNPQIAMAQSMADLRQTLGDFRRGQDAAPDLVNFINQQSQLQQKFEEVKIRALNKMMPAVLRGMELFEMKVLPTLETIFEGLMVISRAILGSGTQTTRALNDIELMLQDMNRPDALALPTNIIREFASPRDVFTERPDMPFGD